MLENKSYFKIEYSSERKFRFLFALVLLIISLYLKYYGNDINYLLVVFSLLFFISSIFFSQLFYYFYFTSYPLCTSRSIIIK